MQQAAQILREGKEKYARTMALEMGKPIVQGEAEVEKCAWACDYYAEHAEAFLADQPRETDASRSYIRFDPIGPVLAIMPWNFPFWQVFRFAAPALMAGNAGILKHASNVPRCALQIEEVFREAGFPENLFRAVLVGSDTVAGIIADPRIRAVTLTGSDSAGSKVAEQAGRELKKTVLELGGSDPFIVLEDADIQKAAKTAADARLINSGQSCIAAKRFIVVEKVANTFPELFVSEMRVANDGRPARPRHPGRPAGARRSARRRCTGRWRSRSSAAPNSCSAAGCRKAPALFIRPRCWSGVKPGMPAFDEETFGPVAAVIRAQDEADAIRLANDSPFGLGASLWTKDLERAERIAAEIEAGCVFVNELVKSDPRLPFGGIKRSGYGRELSEYGIREFMNIKSVWMASSGKVSQASTGLSE